jgi:hypothetical protein
MDTAEAVGHARLPTRSTPVRSSTSRDVERETVPAPAPGRSTLEIAGVLRLQRVAGNVATREALELGGPPGTDAPRESLIHRVVKGTPPDTIDIDDALDPWIQDRFYPGMSPDDANRALSEIRTRVTFEIGATINAGRVVRVRKGTPGTKPGEAHVNMGQLVAGLPAGGKVVTHTHPNGLPLSGGDVGQAAKYNLDEVQAAGLTLTSLRRGPGDWVQGVRNPQQALLDLQNAYGRYQSEWPTVCQQQLGWTQDIKGLRVGTEIKIKGNWVDLAKDKFLLAYWACKRIAEEGKHHFSDGVGSDIRAYARLLLDKVYQAPLDVLEVQPHSAPRVVIDYPAENERLAGPAYTIRLGANASAVLVELQIDGGGWRPARLASGYWWFDWSAYARGSHSIQARVSGPGGATSISQLRTVVY